MFTNFNFPIYAVCHHGCTDGFASYWVMVQRFGADNVVYVPGSHGNKVLPLDLIPEGSDVVIADFSFSRDQMKELASHARTLTVLDHHASAEEELSGLDKELGNVQIEFDMERSGAGITWDAFFPDQERPLMIDYIEDRDIWRNSLPNWEQISAYIQNIPRTLEHYDSKIFNRPVPEIIVEGQGAYDTRTMIKEGIASGALLAEFTAGDIKIQMPLAASPYSMGSESADQMIKLYDYDAAAYFYFNREGGIHYGFRSRHGFDVSKLAVALGGGGHRSAAGCGPFDATNPPHEIVGTQADLKLRPGSFGESDED